MSDQLQYYFRQRPTAEELSLGLQLLEQADHNLATDIGIFGIVEGAEPTAHAPLANLSVDLNGRTLAYDRLGQRIFIPTTLTADLTVDADGLPTDIVNKANIRWLSISLRFDRKIWDERLDGNSQKVFFRHDEGCRVIVRQSAEALPSEAQRPAIANDEVLVCDVMRRFKQKQIVQSDISVARKQMFHFAKAHAVEVAADTWRAIAGDTVQGALNAVDAALMKCLTQLGNTEAIAALRVEMDKLGEALGQTSGTLNVEGDLLHVLKSQFDEAVQRHDETLRGMTEAGKPADRHTGAHKRNRSGR